MITNDPQHQRPHRSEVPRNDATRTIAPTRTSGTPYFPGWGPKLL